MYKMFVNFMYIFEKRHCHQFKVTSCKNAIVKMYRICLPLPGTRDAQTLVLLSIFNLNFLSAKMK